MYGMVNKAVEGLVCQQFGEEAWEAIKERAGVEVDHRHGRRRLRDGNRDIGFGQRTVLSRHDSLRGNAA